MPENMRASKITRSEAKHLMQLWDKATFPTRSECIRYHAIKHGFGNNVWKYLRKASNFKKKGAKKMYRASDGSTIDLKKNGEFVIERNGKIISYGMN